MVNSSFSQSFILNVYVGIVVHLCVLSLVPLSWTRIIQVLVTRKQGVCLFYTAYFKLNYTSVIFFTIIGQGFEYLQSFCNNFYTFLLLAVLAICSENGLHHCIVFHYFWNSW